MTSAAAEFRAKGVITFDTDMATAQWVEASRPRAETALDDPGNAHWYQCDGTWFVGVDALDNAADGSVGGVALAGPALDLIDGLRLTPPKWHRAQISVLFPGYPRPREGESPGAFRYRETRDAAHVDGLHAEGPARRRYLREPHAFILGLPLNHAPTEAAPLVAWLGSHKIMAAAMAAALANRPPETWGDVDLTDVYAAARRGAFARCKRVELPATPGQATLLHRMTLHGIAPWRAQPEGKRMVAYFRPELPDVGRWPRL